VVEGLLHHYLPDAQWRPLIASFGYTTGFVIVVLGRQQLFTENTLTGVIPVRTRRDPICTGISSRSASAPLPAASWPCSSRRCSPDG
jgi:hypothetical protein